MIIDSKDRFGTKQPTSEKKEEPVSYITKENDRTIIKKPVTVLSTKNNTKRFQQQKTKLIDTKPSFTPFKWMGFGGIPAIPVLVDTSRTPDPFPPDFDPLDPMVA